MKINNKTAKNKIVNNYKLKLIFDMVLNKSYQLRKKNPNNFDGQAFWQPIKKILEPLDTHIAKKWKNISKTKTKKIMNLPEYTINGYDEKKIDEHNHFIIQQVRIPLNDKPTSKKIVQIALNIGQYKGINKDKYLYNIKFTEIEQFLYKKDIIMLSAHISDSVVEKIKEYTK